MDLCLTVDDGTTTNRTCGPITVTAGDLTDDGDGTYSLATAGAATVTEGTAIDVVGNQVSFDSTEVGSTTWGSGSGITWTFNAGAVDPTTDFASGSVVHNEGGSDVDFRWEGVGEANALFIQGSDGFVGIGTNAPTQKLHLKHGSAVTLLVDNNGALQTELTSGASTGLFGTVTNHDMGIRSNSLLRMIVKNSGDVRIGAAGTVNFADGSGDLYVQDELEVDGAAAFASTVDITGALTAATLDTGQGANELYGMDQNVLTTSDVTFHDLTLSGTGPDLRLAPTGSDVFHLGSEAGSLLLLSNVTDTVHYLVINAAHTMRYGDANVPAHLFQTSGTGDSAVRLPAGSIGVAELDAIDTPADAEVLSFDAATGRAEWVAQGVGSGDSITVNSVAASDPDFQDGDIDWTLGGGGTTITATVACTDCVALATETTGNYVADITGGAGITATGGGSENATVTLTTDSTEANFLASGALTCGAGTQGKAQVHTTPLQYCDNAATPALQYAAYGSSTGVATSATALAANGANCSAGSYPLGVDASGASESCTVAAATAADYITGSAQATLSAEQSLGALTTGLLLNTVAASTGTLSAYGGTSCTNQFIRSLNASGAATCAAVGAADITDGAIGYADVDATDTLGGNPARGASAVWFGTTGLIFEGATSDTVEGLLTAADPTSSDKTWTLPNETGTLCTTGSVCSGYQASLANYVATVADGTGIDGTATGAGSTYTPVLDLTELSTVTWGAGAFTTMTFDAGATDPVFTAGNGTFTIAPGGSDLLVTDDLELQDPTPHLRLTDTTASEDDYELYADKNMVYLSNVDTGNVIFQAASDNVVTLRGWSDTRCMSIDDVVAADDDILFHSFARRVTINEVWCHCAGTCTTMAAFALETDSGTAMTHTAPTCRKGGGPANAQAVTANNVLRAREGMRFDVTNTPSPTTDDYLLCVAFTYNPYGS